MGNLCAKTTSKASSGSLSVHKSPPKQPQHVSREINQSKSSDRRKHSLLEEQISEKYSYDRVDRKHVIKKLRVKDGIANLSKEDTDNFYKAHDHFLHTNPPKRVESNDIFSSKSISKNNELLKKLSIALKMQPEGLKKIYKNQEMMANSNSHGVYSESMLDENGIDLIMHNKSMLRSFEREISPHYHHSRKASAPLTDKFNIQVEHMHMNQIAKEKPEVSSNYNRSKKNPKTNIAKHPSNSRTNSLKELEKELRSKFIPSSMVEEELTEKSSLIQKIPPTNVTLDPQQQQHFMNLTSSSYISSQIGNKSIISRTQTPVYPNESYNFQKKNNLTFNEVESSKGYPQNKISNQILDEIAETNEDKNNNRNHGYDAIKELISNMRNNSIKNSEINKIKVPESPIEQKQLYLSDTNEEIKQENKKKKRTDYPKIEIPKLNLLRDDDRDILEESKTNSIIVNKYPKNHHSAKLAKRIYPLPKSSPPKTTKSPKNPRETKEGKIAKNYSEEIEPQSKKDNSYYKFPRTPVRNIGNIKIASPKYSSSVAIKINSAEQNNHSNGALNDFPRARSAATIEDNLDEYLAQRQEYVEKINKMKAQSRSKSPYKASKSVSPGMYKNTSNLSDKFDQTKDLNSGSPKSGRSDIFFPEKTDRSTTSFMNATNMSFDYSVIEMEYGNEAITDRSAIENESMMDVNEFSKPVVEDNKKARPIAIRSNDNLSNRSQLNESNISDLDITRSMITTRDNNGKKKINQYIVIKHIDAGSYGKVKLCMHENTKEKFAMKVLNKKKLKRIFVAKNRSALENVEMEIAIMKKLNHANVVKLIEVIDDPKFNKLYIIMEYVRNGALSKKLKKGPLPLEECRKYFRDIIRGLEYCHECAGVIHRDIKPDNILLTADKTIKIADFGVSHLMENGCDDITNTAGSDYYLAPEVCKGLKYKGRQSDIWACGVTLYLMATGKIPFDSHSVPDLYNKIQHEEPHYPSNMDPLLKDLLTKILHKDPKKRWIVKDIKKHDWITDCGKDKMEELDKVHFVVEKEDISSAFTKVKFKAKINLKFRKKINELRKNSQIGM